MTRYYRVPESYWIQSRGWEDRLRLLGVYVQTCTHRNGEGLFRLPTAYIAADLDWPTKTAEQKLGDLISTGFVLFDPLPEVLLLPSALEVQRPATEKQIEGAINRLRELPASPLLCELYAHANAHANGLAEAMRMHMAMELQCALDADPNGHANGSLTRTRTQSLAQALAHTPSPSSEGSDLG